jgi:hypothetical protein
VGERYADPFLAARRLWVISGCAGPSAARQVNPNKRTPAHETERTYLAIRHPRADDNVFDLLI